MWGIAALGSVFVLLLGWLWWAKQEGARAAAKELEVLINEARMVSQDMEAMLNSAVDLSKSVVEDFEVRLKDVREEPKPAKISPAEPDPVLQFYQELTADVHREALLRDVAPEPHDLTPQADVRQDLAIELNSVMTADDFEVYRNIHPTLAVNRLYNQGLDVCQIAQILRRGQGEVHLILNLARKKKLEKAT